MGEGGGGKSGERFHPVTASDCVAESLGWGGDRGSPPAHQTPGKEEEEEEGPWLREKKDILKVRDCE